MLGGLVSVAMLLPSLSLLMFSTVAAVVAAVFGCAAVCDRAGRESDQR